MQCIRNEVKLRPYARDKTRQSEFKSKQSSECLSRIFTSRFLSPIHIVTLTFFGRGGRGCSRGGIVYTNSGNLRTSLIFPNREFLIPKQRLTFLVTPCHCLWFAPNRIPATIVRARECNPFPNAWDYIVVVLQIWDAYNTAEVNNDSLMCATNLVLHLKQVSF